MKSRRTALIAWGLAVAMTLPVTVSAGRIITVPGDEASTISRAFLNAQQGDTIEVKGGVYRERIFVEAGVVLRSRTQFGAIIDGSGRGTVVTLGRGTTIDGFEIRNGTIGIFSKNPGTVIRNCRIVGNWQTGIICVRHLPLVEDNVIAFNRGSGIQGWDVRTAGSSINHNTIAFNSNNGIAIGGKSSVIIQKNIIAHNERLALKILPEVEKATITENNFFKNLSSPTPLPKENYSFNPHFGAARTKLDFTVPLKATCAECPKDDLPGARAQSSMMSSSGGMY